MCGFYMGIAQIALDPPPLCQKGKREKVPQTILASPYTPGQCGKKCPKPSWQAYTPLPPYGQCPYGNNTFQKEASLTFIKFLKGKTNVLGRGFVGEASKMCQDCFLFA